MATQANAGPLVSEEAGTSASGVNRPHPLLPEGTQTLMFRYIPRRFTAEDVVAELQVYIPPVGFDFVYVPKYRTSKCNMGYAFVNFTSPEYALVFAGRLATLQRPECTLDTRFRPQMKVEAAHLQGFAANYQRIVSDPSVDQTGCARILHEGEIVPLELAHTCKEITPTTSPSLAGQEPQATLQDWSNAASSSSMVRKASQVATIGKGSDGLWQGSSSEEEDLQRALARASQVSSQDGQLLPNDGSERPIPASAVRAAGEQQFGLLGRGCLVANGFRSAAAEAPFHSSELDVYERSRDEVQILLEQLQEEGMF